MYKRRVFQANREHIDISENLSSSASPGADKPESLSSTYQDFPYRYPTEDLEVGDFHRSSTTRQVVRSKDSYP